LELDGDAAPPVAPRSMSTKRKSPPAPETSAPRDAKRRHLDVQSPEKSNGIIGRPVFLTKATAGASIISQNAPSSLSPSGVAPGLATSLGTSTSSIGESARHPALPIPEPVLSSAVQPAISAAVQPGSSSVVYPALSSAVQPPISSAVQPAISSVVRPALSSVVHTNEGRVEFGKLLVEARSNIGSRPSVTPKAEDQPFNYMKLLPKSEADNTRSSSNSLVSDSDSDIIDLYKYPVADFREIARKELLKYSPTTTGPGHIRKPPAKAPIHAFTTGSHLGAAQPSIGQVRQPTISKVTQVNAKSIFAELKGLSTPVNEGNGFSMASDSEGTISDTAKPWDRAKSTIQSLCSDCRLAKPLKLCRSESGMEYLCEACAIRMSFAVLL
jgi:hypothetical protein